MRQWVKLRERNEALDLEVYALAALYIMGQPFRKTLKERAEKLALPGEAAAAPEADPAMPAPRRGVRRLALGGRLASLRSRRPRPF